MKFGSGWVQKIKGSPCVTLLETWINDNGEGFRVRAQLAQTNFIK